MFHLLTNADTYTRTIVTVVQSADGESLGNKIPQLQFIYFNFLQKKETQFLPFPRP